MDSSSSIRPEASTVHRAASTGAGLPEDSLDPNQSKASDPAAVNPVPDDLEGAETVIRQDAIGQMMSAGSSRHVKANQDLQTQPHGSSRSRVKEGSAPSQNATGPVQQTPASLTKELQGQRLNHFELLEQTGGGGMGAVFRARDERLGRTVAVKVVPFAAGDPDLQRRFRNEAQSAAKLDHPLIARVFEVGNDGPWYYIVFEYIDGRNIRDIVMQDGPLSLDDAVYYTCQVAEAIGHASKRGIVHRDIKPSNVVVTEANSIKLVDMGLARSESFETSEDMTASGVTLGTFDYISPEQAHDPRLADLRSDLYSLGCTFFYMLTGSPPFPGGTMLQKLLKHGNAAIPDVHDQREDASEDLNAILRKMLAKQPDQRYQNSQALIADLRELALREDLVRSRGVDVVAVESDNRLMNAFLGHLPWVVAATLLIVSAGWLELFSWQQRSEFSSKLAATVPSSAFESLPVSVNSTADDSPNADTSTGIRAGNSIQFPPARDTPFTPLIEPSPIDNGSPRADASSMDVESGVTPIPGELGNGADREPGLATESSPQSGNPPTVGPAVNQTIGGATDSIGDERRSPTEATGTGNPLGMGSTLLPTVPAMTADAAVPPDGSMVERLPSDPPSLRGFPFPVNTDSSQAKVASDARSRSPIVDDLANAKAPEAIGSGTMSSTDNDVSPNELGSEITAAEIRLIRISDAATVSDVSMRRQARLEGVALVGTVSEALALAKQSQSERIEIDTPLLVSEPFVVGQDDLVIASSVPGGTAIVFRSENEADMQRSEMISIGSNRIEFDDLHFYWTVPVTETDGGALLSMSDNRRVRLTDCSITIDNPSRRDEIFAFNITTNASSSSRSGRPETYEDERSTTEEPEELIDTMPLVSIELYNVIVRGQISMLSMDVAAELQLLWENGLLAVSKRMIETGGSSQEPQPKSGSIRLSLQRLTAFTPQGLIQMRLGSGNEYPVEIDRRAEESVFVVSAGSPHVEITGTLRDDRETPWLRIRGASNAYETDATLSDPLLIVRDAFGQTNTTTMSDLAANDPTNPDYLSWADDRTPRWVVRWSDPLPESMPASRMIPADFRQDGSLFAGFQERSLPKMPMQRTFDIAPYE